MALRTGMDFTFYADGYRPVFGLAQGFNTPGVKLALLVFLIQLVLNVLWSFLFFGLRSPLAGLIEIVILWLAILVTVILFFRVSVPAGVLLLPYIGWVTFATILNAAIVKLNL